MIPENRKYGLLVVLFLSIIIVSIYYLLGGFEKVEVYSLPGESRLVAGAHYRGKPNGREIKVLFEKARALVVEEKIPGTLAFVEFTGDEVADGTVHYFIGVQLKYDMAEIPEDFEIFEIDGKNRLAMYLSMHPLVRPSPSRNQKKIARVAKENNWKLQDFNLELHYLDNSMSVEMWTRN